MIESPDFTLNSKLLKAINMPKDLIDRSMSLSVSLEPHEVPYITIKILLLNSDIIKVSKIISDE